MRLFLVGFARLARRGRDIYAEVIRDRDVGTFPSFAEEKKLLLPCFAKDLHKDEESLETETSPDQRPRSMASPPPPSVPTVSEATLSAEETLGRGSEQPPPIGAYDWSALASGGGDGEGAHEGQAGGELTAGGGELDELSIRDLKELIISAGLSTDGCLDRQDLLQRAREAMASAHHDQTREQNQEPRGEKQHKLQDQEPFNPLAWLFSA